MWKQRWTDIQTDMKLIVAFHNFVNVLNNNNNVLFHTIPAAPLVPYLRGTRGSVQENESNKV
jgi:hypothetical protein